jgi:multidrug efflux pump subunit AcrB
MSNIKEAITQKLREFSLTSLAVDNATSVFILTFMIMLFGVQAYDDMPKEQFPEASLPTVYINTPYFGNSAEEIESFVSRPIETELESTTGVKYITSTSIQDFSVIIVEFNADVDMTDAVRKVKDAVDLAKSELPTDLTSEPKVVEVNLSEIPIMTINVSGDYPVDALTGYAELIQDRVEALRQISRVDMKGDLEREVQIDANMSAMESVKVSFNDVENAVRSENLTMSGGEMVMDKFKRAVRIVGQFSDVNELKNMIVKSENQRPVYLKDIANVNFGYESRTSYARSDRLPVISLDVIKRRGENLLAASDEIKVILDETTTLLPPDLKVSLFNDQSVSTRTEVSNLENSIISGVILVVLVLLFFLGLRNAMFVGMAIPLSMLMGILILHMTGVTMNIVVLFSLILALGLLVDNGIVVVENIYRYMQNGYKNKEAAKYGAGEVAWPIIASTATTLAAFVPLAFWPGIMGEFLKYMPITLIIVLSSSLFVALVINPVFTSKFMKIDERLDDRQLRRRKVRNFMIGVIAMLLIAALAHLGGVNWVRNLLGITVIVTVVNFFLLRPASFGFQNKVLPVLERVYYKFISFALGGIMPILFLIGTFGLLVAAIVLLVASQPKVEFFPAADPLYVNVFVELPMGTDIEATNTLMKSIENDVIETLEPDIEIVEAVLTQIGENTSDPNAPPEPGVTPNKGRITISFVKAEDRGGKSTRTIMENVREAVKGYPGVVISVDKNADGPAVGKPINIELRAEDIDSLIVFSDKIVSYIESKNIGGIEELKADVKLGKPELLVNIDRNAARRYELSTFGIAESLRTSVFGKEISKYKQGEDEYPIMLRMDESNRNSVSDLLNQKITFRNPANGRIAQVPISAVADIEYSSTYSAIKRKDGKRMITLSSNVLEGYTANEVVGNIQDALNVYKFPEGFTYAFTGEQQQQSEDTAFLGNAFLIALFAIFIIIVAQFNSVITPFIIVLSILFSTIGVFIGYVLTGETISVIFTGVGIISLAGVVVNNAIVLIDYINLLIKGKKEEYGVDSLYDLTVDDVRESIIQGGATRLRPVLLTAITTVLGLIPLAVGFNFNFFTLISDLDPNIFIGGDSTAVWGPMARTVMYGLTFATFLTLVMVPVMFWLAYRANFKINGLLNKKPALVPITPNDESLINVDTNTED